MGIYNIWATHIVYSYLRQSLAPIEYVEVLLQNCQPRSCVSHILRCSLIVKQYTMWPSCWPMTLVNTQIGGPCLDFH
jgi:hypothetical protein